MINFRTDFGISPTLDLRPMQRTIPAAPSLPTTAGDVVDLRARGGPQAPKVSAAPMAAPAPTIVNPLFKALEPTSDRAVRDATIHREADPDAWMIAGASAKELDPHTRKHFPGLALMGALVMAAGVLMGPMMGCAHADDQVPRTSVSQTLPSDAGLGDQMQRVSNLAGSLGISPNVLSTVADGRLTSALEKLRPDVREMYKTLAPQHKLVMAEKLQGSSGFLFIRVSNKDAFINGEAAGVNAFDHMQKTLADTVSSGKLDAGTAKKLSGAIETFRTMTPDQRAAVVKVLEADVATLR